MHEDPEHGCNAKTRGWCDPDATLYNGGNDKQCPYKPEHLKQMLEAFESDPNGYMLDALVGDGIKMRSG